MRGQSIFGEGFMLNFDNLQAVFFEQGKIDITERAIEFKLSFREYKSFFKSFEDWAFVMCSAPVLDRPLADIIEENTVTSHA